MLGGFGWIELIVLLTIWLVMQVIFIRSVRVTLALTRTHHTVSPESAWALMIPVFNLFWLFHIVGQVSQGIKGRFAELKMDCQDAGAAIGYAIPILSLAVGIPVPFVPLLAGLGMLVCFALYVGKLNEYNKIMEAALGQGGNTVSVQTVEDRAGTNEAVE